MFSKEQKCIFDHLEVYFCISGLPGNTYLEEGIVVIIV